MISKILTKGGRLIGAAIALLAFFGRARAGPIEPDIVRPTPTATATVSPTPTASPTATSTPSPTSTKTPSPTPTLDPAIEVTSGHKIDRCLRYLSIVDQWLTLEPSEFEHLDDPILVLSVGAAESGCDNKLVSSVGALGIMQVMPKPWTAPADLLEIPRVNIYWGMWILDRAMDITHDEGRSIRYALAYYNCAYDKVHDDLCGSRGGLHYADEVLDFWYPMFQSKLEVE